MGYNFITPKNEGLKMKEHVGSHGGYYLTRGRFFKMIFRCAWAISWRKHLVSQSCPKHFNSGNSEGQKQGPFIKNGDCHA